MGGCISHSRQSSVERYSNSVQEEGNGNVNGTDNGSCSCAGVSLSSSASSTVSSSTPALSRSSSCLNSEMVPPVPPNVTPVPAPVLVPVPADVTVGDSGPLPGSPSQSASRLPPTSPSSISTTIVSRCSDRQIGKSKQRRRSTPTPASVHVHDQTQVQPRTPPLRSRSLFSRLLPGKMRYGDKRSMSMSRMSSMSMDKHRVRPDKYKWTGKQVKKGNMHRSTCPRVRNGEYSITHPSACNRRLYNISENGGDIKAELVARWENQNESASENDKLRARAAKKWTPPASMARPAHPILLQTTAKSRQKDYINRLCRWTHTYARDHDKSVRLRKTDHLMREKLQKRYLALGLRQSFARKASKANDAEYEAPVQVYF